MNKKLEENTINGTTNRRVYKILTTIEDDPYCDEGVIFYPRWKKGTRQRYPKLMSYQIRMYKTWKHNRKTKWKYKN